MSVFKIDDSLDVFACHGVGGFFGVICVGFFADKAIGGASGLFMGGDASLLQTQFTSGASVAAYSVLATAVILKIVAVFTPIRVADTVEKTGLDTVCHGEPINSVIGAETTATDTAVTEEAAPKGATPA